MGQMFDPQKQTRLKPTKELLLRSARLASTGILVLSAQAFAMDLQQSGTFNTATVEQEFLFTTEGNLVNQVGESNDVSVFQGGNGSDDQVLVTQITQLGELNSANTTQYALQGNIVIQQTGSQNHAQVEQQEIHDASAEIMQTGTNNLVDLRQLSVTTDDFQTIQASITQDGNDNQVTATQHSFDTALLTVTQYGTGNILQLQQNRGEAPYDDLDSDVTVEMTGNVNEVYIMQRSVFAGGRADIRYVGSGNILDLEQVGETPVVQIDSLNSDGNQDSIMQQSGSWQEILIEREDTHNSQVKIVQEGMAFSAHVRQFGSEGAIAELEQFEDFLGAASEIEQTDVNNSLARIEHSYTGVGRIVQSGVDNSQALIRMHSGDDPLLTITQTGGTGNQGEINLDGWRLAHALIDQQGSFNAAQITHTTQVGGGFTEGGLTASITQTGDHNSAIISQNF